MLIAMPWEVKEIEAKLQEYKFVQEVKKVAHKEKKVKFIVDMYINDEYAILDAVNAIPGTKDIRGVLPRVKCWKSIEELRQFLHEYIDTLVKAVEKALKEE